jgi:hypothetical protein
MSLRQWINRLGRWSPDATAVADGEDVVGLESSYYMYSDLCGEARSALVMNMFRAAGVRMEA